MDIEITPIKLALWDECFFKLMLHILNNIEIHILFAFHITKLFKFK